nr:deoxyuridine 5'-triphosphate nucleotidohydrolase [uncultured archaeon]
MKKSKKTEVCCAVCKKVEFVYLSRAKKYNTCSVECMGEYNKSPNNVKCFSCGKEFHLQPKRTKRLTDEKHITCSMKCAGELKKIIYLGRNNPNTKYMIDDNFFKKVDTEQKAYLLGWIASDGNLAPNGTINISIHKKDRKCLEELRDIICKDIPISNGKKSMITLRICSTTMNNDICSLLKIKPEKKSDIVDFPNLENDDLKWAFIRGFFDGDGCVSLFTETHAAPSCNIATNSKLMRKGIIEFVNIPNWTNDVDKIEWYGNNALDFLSKIYDNSSIKLQRKYERYLDISAWVPSISYSRHFKTEHFKFSKSIKEAVSPSKTRASDSGYDLVILKKIKTIGEVEFYDTGIKVKPTFGYYFNLVPRSSITKTGYMLANSIGVIDRTYHGSIIVPLIKIDKNAPDIQLPAKIVQIIPTSIIHVEFKEVEELEETQRAEGGFGSTDLKKNKNSSI